MNKKDYSEVFDCFKRIDKNITWFDKDYLGKGAFGEVRKCIYRNKPCAAKLVEKEKCGKIQPERLRGKNLIEIIKISEAIVTYTSYNLIIMEYAPLGSLRKFFSNFFELKLTKTINFPFEEIVGNNFLRFIIKQIVNGMEILERNEFVHFDIKPENILITEEFNIKLSDFGFLKDLNKEEENKIIIPGGTKGYLSPEYYKYHKEYLENKNMAKKQDYFALGATIFFMKFNRPLLQYCETQDPQSNNVHVINLLQKGIALIKSNLLLEKDFISFLCSLIEYDPDDRPNFEEIYRNKWLNENSDEVKELTDSYFRNDERKLIIELLKSDFLIEKKKKNKNIKKSRFKFVK